MPNPLPNTCVWPSCARRVAARTYAEDESVDRQAEIRDAPATRRWLRPRRARVDVEPTPVVESPPPPLSFIELLERRGDRESWLARDAVGRLIVATNVPTQSEAQRSVLLTRVVRLMSVSDPALLAVLGSVAEGEDTWVLNELDDGVSLRRLQGVARLRPHQAAYIATGVLGGLAALHRAGLWHGAVDAGAVHIGGGGQIRLGGAGTGPIPGGGIDPLTRRCRDVQAAVTLLRVAFGARAPAQVTGLLDGGICAADGDAAAALAAFELVAAEFLTHAPTAEEELAALVGPLRRRDPAPTVVASPPTVRHGSPVGSASGRRAAPAGGDAQMRAPSQRDEGRRHVPLVAALLGAAVAASIGVGLAVRHMHRGSTPTAQAPIARGVSTAGAPKAPAAAPPPEPPARAATLPPPPAPEHAAGVIGVSLTLRSAPCLPDAGSACTLRVVVKLAPHGPERVAWQLDAVDRCTGVTVAQPGSAIAAVPTYAYVFDTSELTIPTSHPAAIYAVTTSPAAAASPPLLVGPVDATC
jgi:hypothetical protein